MILSDCCDLTTSLSYIDLAVALALNTCSIVNLPGQLLSLCSVNIFEMLLPLILPDQQILVRTKMSLHEYGVLILYPLA